MMKKVISLFLALTVSAMVLGQTVTDSLMNYVSGVVRDVSTGRKLENVTVNIPQTNVSVVTNADGYFLLKYSKPIGTIKVSSIGYKTRHISIGGSSRKGMDIRLSSASISLPELYVYQNDPEAIVNSAIESVSANFVQEREKHTSFYRETIQKNGRYIDIAEAILSTFRKGYGQGIGGDRVKVEQGRHIMSLNKRDTLSVKVLGGPMLPVILDAVKNPEILFEDIRQGCYAMTMELPEVIDERTQFVISIKPDKQMPWALYHGRLYIDKQTLSFTRIELSLDTDDTDKASKMMLYKKPLTLRFKPIELLTVINYRDGRINYMNTIFRFKCDWRKRLISRTYICRSEMVVTDVESPYDGPVVEYKNRFRENQTFVETVDDFSNADFWKQYNIIEPSESLEKAIHKLKRQ